MMLENELCSVEIKIDETYTIGSADNHPYDIIYNTCNYHKTDFYRTLSVHIRYHEDDARELGIALIGDFLTLDSDCAVLEGEELIVLQWNTVCKLRITNGTILMVKQLNAFGYMAIFPAGGGYILHGELEITMLDHDFNVRWTFSGRDIFVSVSGKNPFSICDDVIRLYDFEDNYYVLDFNGNCLEERFSQVDRNEKKATKRIVKKIKKRTKSC